MPAQLTTRSHSTSPASVRTPMTSSTSPHGRVMTCSTRTPSTTRTPRARAPRARLIVRSTGLTRPSPGTWKPARRSSVRASGNSSAISQGPISSTSRPCTRWKAATRRYSSSRSASAAASMSPTGLKPVATPGLGLEPGVEVARGQPQPGARLARGPEAGHEPRGVPRRARGQPVALQDEHVGDPEVGQVVGDRGADDTPTDDDDPRPSGQARPPSLTRDGRAARGVGRHGGALGRGGAAHPANLSGRRSRMPGGQAWVRNPRPVLRPR